MVVIARTPDTPWHRLDADGCPKARGVLQRSTHEREDVPEDELVAFTGDDPGARCSDCRWPT